MSVQKLQLEKINQCFLSLQACMDKILDSHGGNTYQIPHINKQNLSKHGPLPASIHVKADVKNWLNYTSKNKDKNEDKNKETENN